MRRDLKHFITRNTTLGHYETEGLVDRLNPTPLH